MTEKDKKIIKSFELCVNNDILENNCDVCPYKQKDAMCMDDLMKDALDLINRLQAENENLEYKLLGVMHFVDKWLDGEELEQDEVNRASAMREKTLQIVEKRQAEIERLKAEDEKYPFKCVMPFNSMVCSRSIEDYDRLIADIGADAIKEFAERLKAKKCVLYDESPYGDYYDSVGAVCIGDINSLVKEMVGEDA